MIKLLLCLVCGATVAFCVLQLRQQELNLNYQTNCLHAQIEAQQAQLWNQQLRIAEETGPSALVTKMQDEKIPLPPPGTTPDNSNWIDRAAPKTTEAATPPQTTDAAADTTPVTP